MLNSICLKVPKNLGEKVIFLAHKFELVNKKLCIKNQHSYLYVPLIRQPNEHELSQLKNVASEICLDVEAFVEKCSAGETLDNVLKKQLPDSLHSSIRAWHIFEIVFAKRFTLWSISG